MTLILPSPTSFPAEPFRREELLHQRFEETARQHPQRIAVRLADPSQKTELGPCLTYEALDRVSTLLATRLKARGAGPKARIAICLPRSLEQYASILAILKSGAAYIPIDWNIPQDRANYIAEESGAALIVTTTTRQDSFPQGSAPKICIDALARELAKGADHAPPPVECGAGPEDEAYIIYTSGSTGKPKGAIIFHRNITYQTRAYEAVLGVTCEDRVFAGASIAFDVSVGEMWEAFGVGAELLVGSEALSKSGSDLAETLTRERVTAWAPVPSLLAAMEDDLPTIRILDVGGEACPPELVRRWSTPNRRLLNVYGPTETTVACTWKDLKPGEPITIGRPIPGFWCAIVSEDLIPVADGAEGELLIGGVGVGGGYLNRPELTAEKFITTKFAGPSGEPERAYRSGDLCRLTPDGDIEYLGRIDTQVKIRGFRVELGEIEDALVAHPAIAQACVNAYPQNGEMRLAGFLVPRDGHPLPEPENLRATLLEHLPEYMTPRVFLQIDALPLSLNGKLDRKALPTPDFSILAKTYRAPKGETESLLCALFEEFTSTPRVGADDDFFDLGGTSIAAMRLIARLRRAHGKILPVEAMARSPTPTTLAQILDALEGETTEYNPFVVLQSQGEGAPFYCIHSVGGGVLHMRHLAEHMGEERPFICIGGTPDDDLSEGIEQMAARYAAALLKRQPEGPYLIGGYSFGATVAYEIARQLDELGHKAALVAVIDSVWPGWKLTPANFPAAAWLWLANLPGLIKDELPTLTPRRLLEQCSRIARGVALRLAGDQPDAASMMALDRFEPEALPAVEAHFRASNAYKPKLFKTPVAVYRARVRPFRQVCSDKAMGWGAVSLGKAETHAIPGNHFSLIREPQVQTLAKLLAASLRQRTG